MKINVHDLAHSKGMPAAATEAMLLMQDRIEAQAAEIEELKSWKAAEEAHHHKLRAEIERLHIALYGIAQYSTDKMAKDMASNAMEQMK